MIIFDLRCGSLGHVFEAWFGSSEDFEAQRTRGLVACPICGSQEVVKAPMAPAVPAKGNRASSSRQMKDLLAAAAAAQKSLLETSEGVGERFADEARAIHLGEAEARAIHGRATRDEVAGLVEEGVPIAPLPFPVVEPGEEN